MVIAPNHTLPSRAALSISIRDEDGHRMLRVSRFVEGERQGEGRLQSVFPQPIALDDQEIDPVIQGLPKMMSNILGIAGRKLTLNAAESADAIEALESLSLELTYALFKGHPRDLYDAAALAAPGALGGGEPTRVVDISVPQGFGFPFELMRWQELPPGSRTPRDTVRSLLGMSAVIARRTSPVSSDGEEKTLEGITSDGAGEFFPSDDFAEDRGLAIADDRLAITLVRHRTVRSSETSYLRETLKGSVYLYGPWPDSSMVKQPKLPTQIGLHLLNPRHGIGDSGPTQRIQVIHMFGHGHTMGTANEHCFEVGENETIPLGALKRGIANHDDEGAANPRPLIFMNACQTATPSVNNHASFGKFFMDNGYLGLIGTIGPTHSLIAADFAKYFYQQLLRGSTVGQAMHEARWHLMDVHHNPLGLLYTFHGNPDLRVSRPQRGNIPPGCTEEHG